MLNSTVVMVAHRLSTVRDFDRIVLMEKGMIVEEGTYPGAYGKRRRICRTCKKTDVVRGDRTHPRVGTKKGENYE